MKTKINIILNEVATVLAKVDGHHVDSMITEIIESKKIVVCGAGRVGMAIRGFGMRLGHLGFTAFTLGDSTVPGISSGDLLIVASGSGETQTIVDLVTIASNNGVRIVAVTGNSESRIGKLANVIVKLEAPSKTKMINDVVSVQPMTSLNEQCLAILFDAIVLKIMDKIGENHESMWKRHSNLE